ncbi:MAG: tRNA threonylcarbamoyladenosine biosynthesis protein [Pirellulaceae bacterium]|nr:MAG: tRNA threonylcarbamoyladenosine biosynthesis protein [Pirellulaceae bacterium]
MMAVPSDSEIRQAAAWLRSGRLVAFPTETVYGLGAEVWNERAVAQVFALKNRPRFDPLIVHIAAREQLQELVQAIPDEAQRLIDRFWPGPLTLVLPKSERVPDLVTAGLSTVAIRQPAHPVALRFLAEAGVPVAAPSANRFGGISPTTAEHVRGQFPSDQVLVLDGGPCPVGIESTVVACAGGVWQVLRHGGTPIEELQRVLGTVTEAISVTDRPLAPGQLARHYAPATPLVVLAEGIPAGAESLRLGLLAMDGSAERLELFQHVELLSERRDLTEAASRLFAAMRRLDAAGLDLIVARPVPEQGLGRAIMDRLRRASSRASPERPEAIR